MMPGRHTTRKIETVFRRQSKKTAPDIETVCPRAKRRGEFTAKIIDYDDALCSTLGKLQAKEKSGEEVTPMELWRLQKLTEWLDTEIKNDPETYGEYAGGQ